MDQDQKATKACGGGAVRRYWTRDEITDVPGPDMAVQFIRKSEVSGLLNAGASSHFKRVHVTYHFSLFGLGHPSSGALTLLVLSLSSRSPNHASRSRTSTPTPLPFLPKGFLSPLSHPPSRRQNTRRSCATSSCARSSQTTRRHPRPETISGYHFDQCTNISPRRQEEVALRAHPTSPQARSLV